jgi:cell division protein FtsL
MLEAYAEYGAVGVIILLFAAQIVFMQKTLMKKLHEIEDMTIKLIDRWNRSDESRDRRHEDMLKEINDISDDMNFMKGRINGK